MKYLLMIMAALLLGVSSLGFSASPQCVDASSDTDGDGWGWENNQSCVVASMACIDSDGDGYGWDGTQSCLTGITVITECIDEDGDGYGWNGLSTCTPDVEPIRRTCVDTAPLGDTWGWDGMASCRIAPVLVGGDTSAIAGIWDTSSADEEIGESSESYVIITVDGMLGYIEKFDQNGFDCYIIEDPVNTAEEGTVVYPLGNNQYRFDYYEIDSYSGELYLDSDVNTIFVNADNVLEVTFSPEEEEEKLYFPAASINADDIERCGDEIYEIRGF